MVKDDNDDHDKNQQQSLKEKNDSISEMSSQEKFLHGGSKKQGQFECPLWKVR